MEKSMIVVFERTVWEKVYERNLLPDGTFEERQTAVNVLTHKGNMFARYAKGKKHESLEHILGMLQERFPENYVAIIGVIDTTE